MQILEGVTVYIVTDWSKNKLQYLPLIGYMSHKLAYADGRVTKITNYITKTLALG